MTLKMISIVLSGAFLIGAAPTPAQASKRPTTGTELLSACAEPDTGAADFCQGYVQAVFDSGHREGASLCISSATTRAEMVSAVVKTLKARPELQPHNAGAIVFAIMSELYPCS